MKRTIHDNRKKDFFITDNSFVDKYAKFVKAPGVVIYTALLRHADANRKAFPGIRHLAKEMGVSMGYASKGVNLLQQYNIISIEQEDGFKNDYTLLDKKQWKKIPKDSWCNQHKKKK